MSHINEAQTGPPVPHISEDRPYTQEKGNVKCCQWCNGEHDRDLCPGLETIHSFFFGICTMLWTLVAWAVQIMSSWDLTREVLAELPQENPLREEVHLVELLANDLREWVTWRRKPGTNPLLKFTSWKSFPLGPGSANQAWNHTTTISNLRCHIPEETLGFAHIQVNMRMPELPKRVGILKFMLAAISSMTWERDLKKYKVIRRSSYGTSSQGTALAMISADGEPVQCPICQLDIRSSSDLADCMYIKTGCRHIFHATCLTQWVDHFRKDSCPYCRTRISVVKHEYIRRTPPSYPQLLAQSLAAPSMHHRVDSGTAESAPQRQQESSAVPPTRRPSTHPPPLTDGRQVTPISGFGFTPRADTFTPYTGQTLQYDSSTSASMRLLEYPRLQNRDPTSQRQQATAAPRHQARMPVSPVIPADMPLPPSPQVTSSLPSLETIWGDQQQQSETFNQQGSSTSASTGWLEHPRLLIRDPTSQRQQAAAVPWPQAEWPDSPAIPAAIPLASSPPPRVNLSQLEREWRDWEQFEALNRARAQYERQSS